MPVTQEENSRYQGFVSRIATESGCFDFTPEQIVWHYTNGAGFLGILQSSRLHATQVAALNDATETRYARQLFVEAVNDVIAERGDEQDVVGFLNTLLVYYNDNASAHNISKFFVASFSGEEDDLAHWDRYGRPNGYAIGFYARGLHREPTSTLFRVVYDREKQERAARELADATVRFYFDGLNQERMKDPELWTREFLTAWDEWVYKLAPLAKAPQWKMENEYRVVHEVKLAEFPLVKFAQRETMLARYIPLDTPAWVKRRATLLPIAKIIIGPGNNYAPTEVSVRLLLDQMGYSEMPIAQTACSLTRP